MTTFSQRIRELRKRNNISQGELGSLLNQTKQNISSWENGNSMPRADIIIVLANQFSVSADYLLGLTDEPTPAAQRQQERKLIQKNQLVDIIDYGEPLDDKDLELLRLRADSALTERITELFRELFQGERNTD